MGSRVFLVLAIVLGVSVARAEDKPWAAGVSKDQQNQALALYTEGNGYFEQDLYADALKRFEAAIEVWDHPAIRYNAALSSMHLDRIEQAFEHLERALRFGAAPFSPDIYKEAVRHEKLLGNQLGEVDVRTSQPLAVTLDGKPLLDGPGSITRLVRVGSHQLVATRAGYLTDTRTVDVQPRAKAEVTLELERPAVARRLVRRWKPWKPYAVLIGGVVVSAIGGVMYLETRGRFAAFDDYAKLHDLNHRGVMLPDWIQQREDNAKGWRAGTLSVLAVGGVVIATGIGLVVMNQPRASAPTTTITPQLGSDRAGLVISGSW